MAQSVRQLARILFGASIMLFGLSFASALFLPDIGMYVALGLLFIASFSMLLASMMRERVKVRHDARVHLQSQLEREVAAN